MSIMLAEFAPNTSSMVKMLLDENKRPSEAQKSEILEAIPSLQQEVLKLEREYNEIDIALAIIPPEQKPDEHLTEQFERLTTRLNNARDILALHTKSVSYGRQIPVEVLEVIFRFCLPDTDFVICKSTEAPLLLCQICSDWRRVALLAPLLWSSLSLHLSRRPGTWKDLLNTWLGRSLSSPVSLSISGPNNPYFNDHIVKVLAKTANRWRRLRLEVEPSSMARLLNHSMPLLHTLEIGMGQYGSDVYLSSLDAPNLRKLVLVGKTDPKRVHVPWGRLTQLDAGAVPMKLDTCLHILSKSKNLTRCTVQLVAIAGTETDLTQMQPSLPLPICLSHLRSLSVAGSIPHSDVGKFFRHIELPKLEGLVLSNLHEGGKFNLDAQSSIVVLARRSGIRRLRLVGGKPLEGLSEIVVSIPSLKEVVLEKEWPLPRTVVEALEMRK
ncbi:F-box domain-containing protein [Favolaschia claudopus]|uniref:F-box domain-containing protein n=1 Tax=Favolaschia claudopus TaxID=2862362 RepID=A0AAW0DXS5_9AGAR